MYASFNPRHADFILIKFNELNYVTVKSYSNFSGVLNSDIHTQHYFSLRHIWGLLWVVALYNFQT